jgi:hypothetical protein
LAFAKEEQAVHASLDPDPWSGMVPCSFHSCFFERHACFGCADKTYASVVYSGNKEFIKGKDIIFGGPGVDLTTVLPDEVDKCEPDYSIYPENNISYGFISRGCIRKCSFCVVSRKEGYIRQVANVDDIVRHKVVKFLDNNILALPNHKDILKEIADKK